MRTLSSTWAALGIQREIAPAAQQPTATPTPSAEPTEKPPAKPKVDRGKVRVAADLSNEGIASIQAEERMESSMAEDALKDLEVELGMRAPEVTPVAETQKDLGPADLAVEKP